MQKCSYCGADLPANFRFCGKCGSLQETIDTNAATTRSNTPLPQSWTPESGTIPATWRPSSNVPVQGSPPAWSPNVQIPGTPLPPSAENEDERRRGVPPWSPLYGAALGGDALLGSGQAYTPGAPVVQGTPQIGNVPSVGGSPTPYVNAPANPSTQWAGNMPVSPPVQKPQPTPHPPKQPGTHEHHPPHKTHRHHTNPLKHEPDHDDLHPEKHVLRREGATKIAGGSTVKTIILVVTAVAVVAAGGIAAAAHFLSHPQPSISITSDYRVGNTLAGANGTVLHISGQQFSSNSAITFLLDGHVAPGIQGTHSDSNGNFSANVTITNAWSAGPHTLSARDGSNYSPQNTVRVTVVQPGQANTPGPNGAPSDDASFKLKVTIASSYSNVADPFSQNSVLIISGHPDPEGGTICSPDDNGQPYSFNETSTLGTSGTQFNKTLTARCSGTYKAGQISFIETSTSVKQYWHYNNGITVTCVLPKPTVDLQLTGAYVGNNTFKGTLSSPYFTYNCDKGYGNSFHRASQGVHWTGTIVTQ